MVSHLVLMQPRADLSRADRAAFVASFTRALREIPSVRGVRIGRRIVHGANYERLPMPPADFIVSIDFDDFAGLRAYLGHPAHEDLGARFYEVLSSALVYDVEIVDGLEGLAT
jgi:stress responsive alpha/beta barrel protein